MKAGAGGIALIGTVARLLGPLREEVAFLGGAAVSLFVSDPAVRSTKDVDLIVEVASRLSYYGLADRLRERGFREALEEGAPSVAGSWEAWSWT